MTSAGPPLLLCDECHCSGKKIHRIYKGRRFCSNCYVRLFKRTLCPGCGNYGRLPLFDTNSVCVRCESKAPCVRCQKTGKPVGLMTPYGPACSSCAHYFKEAEPCDKCGELSSRLTRVLDLDPDVRCCPRCAREGAATCPSCRRHRFLIAGPDGQMRCKSCLENSDSQCLSCNKLVPAGRGSECEDCAWEKSFERRVRIHVEGFENIGTRERFSDFCGWLREHMGPHKAAVKLKHYLSFFSFLDTHFTELPSYVSLLGHFGADGLRRMKTPMLWLKVRYGIEVDETLREEHSEKRRIEEMIASVPAGKGADALTGYRAFLLNKQGEGGTTLRSIRLSLRAAKSVLVVASATFEALPTQKSLSAYLTTTPGQRAAAQGFIGYLNRTHGLSLKNEISDRAVARAKIQKLESTMYAMYVSAGEGEHFERTWIKTALMLFHGLPSVNKKTLSYSPLTEQGVAGFSVVVQHKTYWVPSPASAPNFIGLPTEE